MRWRAKEETTVVVKQFIEIFVSALSWTFHPDFAWTLFWRAWLTVVARIRHHRRDWRGRKITFPVCVCLFPFSAKYAIGRKSKICIQCNSFDRCVFAHVRTCDSHDCVRVRCENGYRLFPFLTVACLRQSTHHLGCGLCTWLGSWTRTNCAHAMHIQGQAAKHRNTRTQNEQEAEKSVGPFYCFPKSIR